jgi:hypothetical protein
MYLIGAATIAVFGFLYFGMVDTAAPLAVFVAIVLSLIPHDMQYGPQAALFADAFTQRLRYSGLAWDISWHRSSPAAWRRWSLPPCSRPMIRVMRFRSTSRRARW